MALRCPQLSVSQGKQVALRCLQLQGCPLGAHCQKPKKMNRLPEKYLETLRCHCLELLEALRSHEYLANFQTGLRTIPDALEAT